MFINKFASLNKPKLLHTCISVLLNPFSISFMLYMGQSKEIIKRLPLLSRCFLVLVFGHEYEITPDNVRQRHGTITIDVSPSSMQEALISATFYQY